MASLCHRPSICMRLWSTLPQSKAMAPPARSDRAEMSLGWRPVVLRRMAAALRSVSVMSWPFMAWRRLLAL
jgi:hypothetical protein